MYCPECGKENSDDARFCSSCGSRLHESSQDTEGVNVKVSRFGISSLIIAIVSLFVLALAVMLTNIILYTIYLALAALAVIFGFVSLIRIGLNGGKITGLGFATTGIIIAISPFLLMYIYSIFYRPRSVAFRMVCGSNLSGIGKAMLIYSNDYDDEFPRAGGKSSVWAAKISDWKAGNRIDAYNLNKDGSGGQASISSSFFLLVKYAEITPESFVCNKDSKTKEFKTARYSTDGKHLIDLWDFGPEPWKHCSYSYHMPYGYYALTTSSEPGMPVAADRNPWIDSPAAAAKDPAGPPPFSPTGGTEAIKIGNAIAHQEDGQNVLFLDSHVYFEKRSFCGVNDDNIYTFWDGGDIRDGTKHGRPVLGSEPQDRLDSLLVHDPPVKNQK